MKETIGQLNVNDRFAWKPGGKEYVVVGAEGKGGRRVIYADIDGNVASVTYDTPIVRVHTTPSRQD